MPQVAHVMRITSVGIGTAVGVSAYVTCQSYFSDLGREVRAVLASPQKMAEVVVQAATGILIGDITVLGLIRQMATRKGRGESKGSYVDRLNQQVLKVLEFFEHVPKSRMIEIHYATGISEERLKLILEALSFVHEPECFWYPKDVSGMLTRGQLFKINLRRLFHRRGLIRIRSVVPKDRTKWEYCRIAYVQKDIYLGLRAECYFWADAIGENGKFNAGHSPSYRISGLWGSAPSGGDENDKKRAMGAHSELVKLLRNNGWEPLQEEVKEDSWDPLQEEVRQWWMMRFRRKAVTD